MRAMTNTTLTDRALIRLSGDGVRDFLQGLVTGDVLGDLPVWAGLLTPQGKALFDFIIWRDGDDLLIDCEAPHAEALMRRLALYRLRRPIVIAPETILAVHWSASPPDEAAQRRNSDMGPWPAGIGHDPRGAALGWRWLAPKMGGDASALWHMHRLSLGIVEGVVELGSDKTLWLECNAREQNGVSFTKGCYIGQENTARMHHRSKVNRRLAVVRTTIDPGETARIYYPDFGFAVIHQRISDTAEI
jgi:tRNA-modifying protein YgfZ